MQAFLPTEAQKHRRQAIQLQFESTVLIPAPFPTSCQGVQGPDCRDAGVGVGRSDSSRGRGFGGGDDCGVRRLGNLLRHLACEPNSQGLEIEMVSESGL